MKYNKVTRRHFLQGVGGSIMTLPLLPSLIPAKAFAQALQSQKFFVVITADHGGTGFSKDWYPAPFIDNLNSNLFTQVTLLPAGGQNAISHMIRHGRLSQMLAADPTHDGGNVDNNQQRLSFILGSFLNPYVNKMNMFSGIDGGMKYYGHSRSMSAGAVFGIEERPTWPTADHFLADSNKFYLNRSSISVPVLKRAPFYSWTSQGVEFPNTADSINEVYNSLFNRYQGTQDPVVVAARARRSFLIDRVLEDYNRIINGNNAVSRRISSVDKARLEQHAEFMFETERKYQNIVNTCSDVANPGFSGFSGTWVPYYNDPRFNPNTNDPAADHDRAWDVFTNLLAAAFSCGASSVANLSGSIDYFLYAGDYHENIVHQHTNSRSAQLTHNRNLRWQAEHLFAAVVRKLDAVDVGNGQTLLDRGLVAFVHESGTNTHDHHNIGCVTAGSANGFFNTGNFVDYRNLQNMGLMYDYFDPNDTTTRPGVPLQRFYSNILQAMGHVPADYRRDNRPGYGADQTAPSYNGTRLNPNRHVPYPTEMVNSFDSLLPIITG